MKTDWIKNLKEGDEIAIDHRYYSTQIMYKDKVKRVTPTGIIKTASGITFNPNGYERGNDHSYGVANFLVSIEEYNEWFAENGERIEKEKLIREIRDAKLMNLSLQDLRDFAAKIKQSKVKT